MTFALSVPKLFILNFIYKENNGPQQFAQIPERQSTPQLH